MLLERFHRRLIYKIVHHDYFIWAGTKRSHNVISPANIQTMAQFDLFLFQIVGCPWCWQKEVRVPFSNNGYLILTASVDKWPVRPKKQSTIYFRSLREWQLLFDFTRFQTTLFFVFKLSGIHRRTACRAGSLLSISHQWQGGGPFQNNLFYLVQNGYLET